MSRIFPSPTRVLTHTHTQAGNGDSRSVAWAWRSLPVKAWAWLRSCVHVCRSAKALMPKQLVGWSWDCRNSQQTWRTSTSWRRLAAGSRTCSDGTANTSCPAHSREHEGEWVWTSFITASFQCWKRGFNKPGKSHQSVCKCNANSSISHYNISFKHSSKFARLLFRYNDCASNWISVYWSGMALIQIVPVRVSKQGPKKSRNCLSPHR